MRIGGFQKVSLIDYPGQIGSVVFAQGCNMRCPYCHNPELVEPALYKNLQDVRYIMSFLEMRKGKIDAVTITGGEPTLQSELKTVIKTIHNMGYLVKLDTNGTFPEVLKTLIEAGDINYIAMDIKAPFAKYAMVTRSAVEPAKIRESIDIIMSSGIEYEFRTTAVPSLTTLEDLLDIISNIKDARCYAVQAYVPVKILYADDIGVKTFSPEEMNTIKETLDKYLPNVIIRC